MPIGSGNVFVANSRPNPFRNEVTLSFNLAQSGPVTVEIYSADGRRVETLAKGELPAGPQSIRWQLNQNTPSGVYFYKVLAGADQATGKLMRVE